MAAMTSGKRSIIKITMMLESPNRLESSGSTIQSTIYQVSFGIKVKFAMFQKLDFYTNLTDLVD